MKYIWINEYNKTNQNKDDFQLELTYHREFDPLEGVTNHLIMDYKTKKK